MKHTNTGRSLPNALPITMIALLWAAGQPAHAQAPNTPTSPTAPQTPTASEPNRQQMPGIPGQATQVPVFGQSTGTVGQTPAPPILPRNGGSVPLANPDPSPRFDINRTVSDALRSSADIQQAQRNVEIDRKRAGVTAAENRLNVSGNASATRFDQATSISIAGGPPVTVLEEHTEAASIVISQRLDLLGQVRAAVNQARLQALSDQFMLEQITNQRALQAKSVYYNVLRADHQVQVAESALRSVQAQRDVARKLYEGQIGQKIDYLRAETQVAQAEQDLTRAQNDRDLYRASFNDLVGRPLTAPIELTDVAGVSVGIDLPAPAASAPVGTPSPPPVFTPFAPPTGEIVGINVEQNIQTAQIQRPEVAQNEVQVRVEDTGIRLARVGQEPTFALSASGNYYPTTSFQFPRQRTAALTATITFPFYDGGATRNRIAEARLRTENARTALESAKSGVALDVRQAYLNLSTTARQIAAANAALTQAIAARQLAQVRYEGQVGLYLEVTDAQAALVRAENNQVDAVYNYLIARAQYDYALGNTAPAAGTAAKP